MAAQGSALRVLAIVAVLMAADLAGVSAKPVEYQLHSKSDRYKFVDLNICNCHDGKWNLVMGDTVDGVEGESFGLSCFIQDYRPVDLSWWTLGSEMSSVNKKGHFVSTTKIIMKSLRLEDDGRNFTCQGDQLSVTRTVTLRVKPAPRDALRQNAVAGPVLSITRSIPTWNSYLLVNILLIVTIFAASSTLCALVIILCMKFGFFPCSRKPKPAKCVRIPVGKCIQYGQPGRAKAVQAAEEEEEDGVEENSDAAQTNKSTEKLCPSDEEI